MKKIYVLAATLLCAAIFMSANINSSAKADNFWMKAAESGLAEVALGNLAVQRAQSEAVRTFAQQMVTDHTAANNELITLAQGKSIVLPTTMDRSHQAAMEKLNRVTGPDFDREYMKQMVKDHRASVRLFEKTAQTGDDADAKAFAAKHLPTIQMHFQMATTLSGEVGNSGTNGNARRNNANSTTMDDDSGNSNRAMNTNSNRRTDDQNMNTNSNMRMDDQNMNTNSNTRTGNQNTNSNMNTTTNTQSGNRNTNTNSGNRNTNMNTNSGNTNANNGNSNGNTR